MFPNSENLIFKGLLLLAVILFFCFMSRGGFLHNNSKNKNLVDQEFEILLEGMVGEEVAIVERRTGSRSGNIELCAKIKIDKTSFEKFISQSFYDEKDVVLVESGSLDEAQQNGLFGKRLVYDTIPRMEWYNPKIEDGGYVVFDWQHDYGVTLVFSAGDHTLYVNIWEMD